MTAREANKRVWFGTNAKLRRDVTKLKSDESAWMKVFPPSLQGVDVRIRWESYERVTQ